MWVDKDRDRAATLLSDIARSMARNPSLFFGLQLERDKLAEDIVQEVITELLDDDARLLREFRDRGLGPGALYTRLRWRAKTQRQRQARWVSPVPKDAGQEAEPAGMDRFADRAKNPQQETALKERVAIIQRIAAAIGDGCRLAIHFLLRELKPRDVLDLVGTPEGLVGKKSRHSRKKAAQSISNKTRHCIARITEELEKRGYDLQEFASPESRLGDGGAP